MSRGKEPFVELKACASWPDAEKMLHGGVSAPEVAEYMQRQGDMVGIKQMSLARQLDRYKSRVVIPLARVSLIDEAVKNRDLNIDNLEELTKLILIQKDRVERDLALEQKMPKSMPSLTKEIGFLFELLKQRERIMQESGRSPRAPQTHLHAVVGEGSVFEKMLNRLPDDQREEIRAAIQMGYAEDHHAIEAPYREIDDDEDV